MLLRNANRRSYSLENGEIFGREGAIELCCLAR